MSLDSPLFSQVRVGHVTPSHRVVMAPMTRRRADDNFVPSAKMVEYYSQRASTRGTLIISEAVAVSPRAAAPPNTPGLWTQQQIDAWKLITAGVHSKGSFIYAQLWMCGRALHSATVLSGAEAVSSGNIPSGPDSPVPRPLSEIEIHGCIEEFASAARAAIDAGFDGIELHGANGYLLDQFTQSMSNNREDVWGGSVENRSRFPVTVASAVATAIGPERVGYRVSPFSHHHGMGMDDPRPQFEDLVRRLKDLKLGYLHVIESRVQGPLDVAAASSETVDFLADIWGTTSPIIFAGGYNAFTSRQEVEEEKVKGREALVAFGRMFVSNPDLPVRIQHLLPVSAYRRDLFYEVGRADGYLDYNSYEDEYGLYRSETIGAHHVWPTGVASAVLK